jgi:hypothetical protein
VTFEVERFEWVSGDRLELVGRWFGVRGRRFLRPMLDVEVEGDRRRVLALLEHKPWAADDGEEWVATFAWEGDRVAFGSAELAVGPDLAVELPQPSGPARGRKRRSAGRAQQEKPRRSTAALLKSELATARAEIERLKQKVDRGRATHAAEAEELRTRLAAEQREALKLAADLQSAHDRSATDQADAARRLDEAARERESAAAQREDARSAAEQAKQERDALLKGRATLEAERDAAVRTRDKVREERNAWLSSAGTASAERDGAVAARVAAAAERDAAVTERDRAAAERDSAVAARGRAVAERARLVAERDKAVTERDAARAGRGKAVAERDRAVTERDAARAERGSAVPERGTVVGERDRAAAEREAAATERGWAAAAPIAAPSLSGGSRRVVRTWAPRVAALVALAILVAIVALLIAWTA